VGDVDKNVLHNNTLYNNSNSNVINNLNNTITITENSKFSDVENVVVEKKSF